jgi:hypothetical protein
MLQTGRSLRAHTPAASSGTRVVPNMPKAVREPEMMDVDEPVVPKPTAPETAAPKPVEPPVEPEEEEEEEEYEETITLRASDFVAFHDILEDM